ncbi:MAG: hypothetical protein H2174_06655 [Vampirovibrio sp.]|nr:hypothetical protein [Vampirovibrio sp.]
MIPVPAFNKFLSPKISNCFCMLTIIKKMKVFKAMKPFSKLLSIVTAIFWVLGSVTLPVFAYNQDNSTGSNILAAGTVDAGTNTINPVEGNSGRDMGGPKDNYFERNGYGGPKDKAKEMQAPIQRNGNGDGKG